VSKTYIDMGKNKKEPEEIFELPVIRGASHTPQITKGVYQVGCSPTGRLDYNRGPVPWQSAPKSFGGALARMAMKKDFYGDSMCGDCISIKLVGSHDPRIHLRQRCQLCGTIWPGLEPDNDRRGAIEAQKAKKK
jgi:hypothetical protein